MTPTVPNPARVDLLPRSENRKPMAKAALRKAENPIDPTSDNDAGAAITEARNALGWTLKDFARVVKKGERQLARWEDGTEHPQLDTLFAIILFRKPLIIALAKRAGLGVGVQTTITIAEAA